MFQAILLSVLALIMLTGSARASEQAWAALAANGIVLFRHAQAPGTGDPPGYVLGDCATQRNLDATGRAQAARIGAAFRDRALRVGRVLTSQWCRTRETAALAFPGQVEDAPAFNSFFSDRSSGPQQTAAALAILEAWRGPGALVVVTHQVNITALTDIMPASGEGVVVDLLDGKIRVVDRLRIESDGFCRRCARTRLTITTTDGRAIPQRAEARRLLQSASSDPVWTRENELLRERQSPYCARCISWRSVCRLMRWRSILRLILHGRQPLLVHLTALAG